MSVPTPASIKQQLDRKKTSESSTTSVSSDSVSSEKAKVSAASSPKKEYVRPEHLTQRPFRDNEQLQALKASLPQNKKTVHKPLTREQVQKKREKDRAYSVKIAQSLKEKGLSNVAIGKRMGIAESSVRNLLKPKVETTPAKENN